MKGRLRFAVDTLLVVVALGVLIALVVVVFTLPSRLHGPSFDPLRLPPQQVLNRVDGVEGPAVRAGDDLRVLATKCNLSGKEIGVSGMSAYRTLEPAGSTVTLPQGSALRPAEPKCVERAFSNALPPAVVARTAELLAAGASRVVWQLTGVETPLGPGGVARGWFTEPFAIVL